MNRLRGRKFPQAAIYGKIAAAGKTFSFRGSDGTSGIATWTSSGVVNIGASTSDRFVIVVLEELNAFGCTAVTVNGVSLTLDISQTAFGTFSGYIFSGLVGTAGGAGPATIVSTWNAGAASEDRAMLVWTGTGMSHTAGAVNTVAAVGGSASISVTAADFLVAQIGFGTTLTGSTETPTATRSVTQGSTILTGPEWNTIVSTNAAFSIVPNAGSTIVAAGYR